MQNNCYVSPFSFCDMLEQVAPSSALIFLVRQCEEHTVSVKKCIPAISNFIGTGLNSED